MSKEDKRKNNGGARAGSGMKEGQASKWPTSEERRAACASLCKHIESGYSVKSWPDASWSTVQRYTKNFPEDFTPESIDRAKRVSLKFWEGLGIAGTSGKLKGFNSRSWEVNMNNRAGWGQNVNHKSEIQFVPIDKEDEDL